MYYGLWNKDLQIPNNTDFDYEVCLKYVLQKNDKKKRKRAKCGGGFAGPVLSYIDGCSVEVVVFYKLGPFGVTLPAELL